VRDRRRPLRLLDQRCRGGFFVARPEWLHRLPDQLSYTMGALVEPFSVAYYALVRAGGVDASDTVVVLGAGPIGLAVVAAAAAMGAAVVVVEPSADRRKTAETLGADHTVSPEDADELLATLTGGRGADRGGGVRTAGGDGARSKSWRSRAGSPTSASTSGRRRPRCSA
jgi:Zn-dependent alcohol dehydrogenase